MKKWSRGLSSTVLVGSVLFVLSATPAAAATTWAQKAELTATDGAASASFGSAISVTPGARTALIGAPGAKAGAGAAYIYSRNDGAWGQRAELLASDTSAKFGNAVSISSGGGTALVGAYMNNGGTGAAYIFTRSSGEGEHSDHSSAAKWTQVAKLTASDGSGYEFFGLSLVLSGDGKTALVGAPGHNFTFGAAYIFTKTNLGWTQTSELTASDGTYGDGFGYLLTLAADGKTALIGATGRNFTGAAYVFTNNGSVWTQAATLTASDGVYGDGFGNALALDEEGQNALVSSPNASGGTGAVYSFSRGRTGAWTQTAKLTASDGLAGDSFGTSVALADAGRTAVIGAPNRANNTGAAYVFTRGERQATLKQQSELTATDAAAGDLFGMAVALSQGGDNTIIGAPGHTGSAGAAYAFSS